MRSINIDEYRVMQKELWNKRMVEKYGSEEAVGEEMARRRSLVKSPGLANASKETRMRVNKAMMKGRDEKKEKPETKSQG